MHRFYSVAAASLLLMAGGALPGCTVVEHLLGLPGVDTDPPPTDNDPDDIDAPANLKAFESEEEFDRYFRSEIEARNGRFADGGSGSADDVVAIENDGIDRGGEAPPVLAAPGTGDAVDAPAADEDGSTGFSQTTIQEQGVDEADVVKTDGTYMYVLTGDTIRIVEASPSDRLGTISAVVLEGHGRQLYLRDDRLIAITETYGGYYYIPEPGLIDVVETEPVADDGREGELRGQAAEDDGEAVNSGGGSSGSAGSADSSDGVAPDDDREPAPDAIEEPQFERPSSIVTVIDVTDRGNPTVVSTTRFDGNSVSSRMIDGRLHLIVANFPHYFIDVMPMLGRPELNPEDVNPEELLPRYTRDNGDGTTEEGAVVTWHALFRPESPDGFGVVSVISMNAAGDTSFTAVGVVADPGLIYSSRNALYMTDTKWNFNGEMRETTSVHKLAYDGAGAVPVASGKVPGRILNQYSMSEHDGYLRVATTVGPRFTPDGERTPPHNNVYVLGEIEGALEVVGSVEDIAPRETIQSARFVGDRGFVVTFEQIDPLFTLDLSDPENPVIVGELKVPGFSTFLVPMDENHLLAVGQYIPEDGFFFAPWGVQLSIFDVSDFANPTLKHNVILGDQQGAYSEALHDPKSFTYFANAGLVAMPLAIYDYEGGVAVDDRPADEPRGAEPPVDDPAVVEPIDSDSPDAADDIFAPPGFEGLIVFDVSVNNGFGERGRISTRMIEQGIFWSSFTRGVFLADEVFAVSNNLIRVAEVDAVETITNELIIGEADIEFLDD